MAALDSLMGEKTKIRQLRRQRGRTLRVLEGVRLLVRTKEEQNE